jgi:CBS domain-containing protein
MEELKVRRLPVIDKNKRMVGVVSRHDIARTRA